MGASAWDARVGCVDGLAESLRVAQEAELAADRFEWPWDEWGEDEIEEGSAPGRPTSLEELAQAKQFEEFWEAGTHSILDVDRVVESDQDDAFGAIVPLQPEEQVELFGTARPTISDLDAVLAEGDLMGLAYEKWSGRAVVLHDQAGDPTQVYFWGWSGD